jgi:hypothetical protein
MPRVNGGRFSRAIASDRGAFVVGQGRSRWAAGGGVLAVGVVKASRHGRDDCRLQG